MFSFTADILSVGYRTYVKSQLDFNNDLNHIHSVFSLVCEGTEVSDNETYVKLHSNNKVDEFTVNYLMLVPQIQRILLKNAQS